MPKITRKVKSVKYNWHQNGSLQHPDGCGEDWWKETVGEKNVKSILESEPTATQGATYIVNYEDGSALRIFNPNLVEYFPWEKGTVKSPEQ